MARCCDPREDITGNISRDYKLGGMGHVGSSDEVIDTMTKIDGVKNASIDPANNQLSIQFDPAKVSEDHLIGTLNSLGHSILH